MAKKEVQILNINETQCQVIWFIAYKQLQHFLETEEDFPSSAWRGVKPFHFLAVIQLHVASPPHSGFRQSP